MSVVGCTDFSGKVLHRQVRRRGYSGDIREPCGVMVSTLAQNARDVGSTAALDTIFPIFITLMTTQLRSGLWELNVDVCHSDLVALGILGIM